MRRRDQARSAHVLVPLKRLGEAKMRLGGILTAVERASLMRAMLADVLSALAQVRAVARVTLVSSEPSVERLAAHHGVAFWDDRGLPWNDALGRAAAEVVVEPVLAIVSADIPLVTADDIDLLVRSAGGVAIARALDGGTNAVAMTPPGAVRTCFGAPRSAARHVQNAVGAGLDTLVVDRPGLALDIDSPVDVARLLSSESGADQTRQLLDDVLDLTGVSPQAVGSRVVA